MAQSDTNKAPENETRGRDFYEPVYTIGVASSKLGLSVHTIRLYEAEGLIIPFKTETGRRLFSDLELEKIKCIKKMITEEGMNFEGMRRMMAFIPCWKLRDCSEETIDACIRKGQARKTPCWASEEKCLHPLPSCRDCPVYRKVVSCEDVQSLVYESCFGCQDKK